MSTVSLIQTPTYELNRLNADLKQLLAPLGGIQQYVKPGARVLLKPNLLTASRPMSECITRPELVRAVAELVIEAGGKPFIGDSPAFGTARGVAQRNGYLPLLESLDIPIVEFHSQRYQTLNDELGHLHLSKEAMNADVVINLPKVKSHVQLTLTLGVKNLFGCVPGKMKAWWHMEVGKDVNRFGMMLVETAKAINPELTILDGIIGHEGNGPSGGEPRPLGLLAAATDVFALDRVMVEILGVSRDLVPTVIAAEKLGLSPQLKNLSFPLSQPQDLSVSDWKLPQRLQPIDFGLPRVIKSTFKHFYIRFIQEPQLR
ncbi:MAG: DUF362 domain-containing protein [Microcoleaceae cyanobacterium]